MPPRCSRPRAWRRRSWLIPLERRRIDEHDVPRTRQRGTLHRTAADAAHAQHDDGLTGGNAGRVDRRAPTGGHTAPDESALSSGMSLVSLTHDASLTTVTGAKVPSRHIRPASWPLT